MFIFVYVYMCVCVCVNVGTYIFSVHYDLHNIQFVIFHYFFCSMLTWEYHST